MDKLIIPLIAKRINFNGQSVYQRPDSGFRRRLFDRLMDKGFKKKHRRIQGNPIENVNMLLKEIIKEFEDENHAFVANFYSDQWDGVQIIHPYMNSDNIEGRNKDFGFSLYFTFDLSTEQVKPYHSKFLLEDFAETDSFIHDELVRCYDINCGMDKEKVYSILKKYFEVALGNSSDEDYYFDLSSHGPINKVEWLS